MIIVSLFRLEIKTNIDELKEIVYKKVRELHVQKYPYNDFLYQTYDEE